LATESSPTLMSNRRQDRLFDCLHRVPPIAGGGKGAAIGARNRGAGASTGSGERSEHGVTGSSKRPHRLKRSITTSKEARSADPCRLGGCWLSRSLHYEYHH